MTTQKLNPAVDAELQRLIAEQAADDQPYVLTDGRLSLDVPPSGVDDASVYNFEEQELETGPAPKRRGRVTAEQVKEWRGLRNNDHWTYQQIADYAGVTFQTVRLHISNGTGERRDSLQFRLEQRFDDLRVMYESGAFLREIAEVTYGEVGFQSWESCYQGLRKLFIRKGVAIRPRDASRRARSGRPAPNAPREEWQRFWRVQNRRAKQRRRRLRVLCDATANAGRPCRNTAMAGSRFCGVHDERTRPQTKWTKEKVLEALQAWAETHERCPKAHDWYHATDAHPNFKTAADLFGRWTFALSEAGLRHGYRCPSCGGWTVETHRRGRPPKCPTCQAAPRGLEIAA